MDVRQIDPLNKVSARRHWEIGKAAEDATRPYDIHPPWESVWLMCSEGREDVDIVLLGAFDGDVMWGAAQVNHTRYDNLHMATSTYHVHPERHRRGIGRAVAEASYDVARRRGRRLMVTEAFAPVDDTSAGLLFAEAMGFATALVDGMKVVDLYETEPLWDALEARSAPRHAEYRIVTWRDRVPDEHVPGYCRLNERFVDEAPMGDLQVEPERWNEQRVRSRERSNARRGRHDVSAGALAPDGTLVGLTEAAVNEHAPAKGIQSGTHVVTGHRGHALGLAMKVANHRQLREHYPECRVLVTGNADVNGPMNAVNEALGYREVERCVEMQRPI